jgi:hypothetical protein
VSFAFHDELHRTARHVLGPWFDVRLCLRIMLFSLPLCFPGISRAKQTCPWLNQATAAGFLDGNVTSTVTHSDANKNDANCDFTLRHGSAVTVLRIEVQTMTAPRADFASYVARCGAHFAPLKAIGNEAFACGFDGERKEVSEQVVGRVRDRAFTVRFTSNSRLSDRTVLREKAQKVAEQVAGFLF